jgi:fused signal recognition particle receptor
MGLFDRLKEGLKKTREATFGKIKKLLSFSKLDEETLEKIEELLITSDVSMSTTERIINALKIKTKEEKDATQALKSVLLELLEGDTSLLIPQKPPMVISVIGVNGGGKTTTVGKLAKRFSNENKEVVLAAADTFRAAAIDQLRVWAEERSGVPIIAHEPGSDSAAVAYDAVSHAIAKKKDIVLIDTAGRLHTKENLMEELKKLHRVIKKVIPEAPHEVLLILDATTGQNGLSQAKKFSEAVGVTGIVLTKLDGTAKGGIALSIKEELKLPIKFIGVGEKVEDLRPFNAVDFVEALLEEEGE